MSRARDDLSRIFRASAAWAALVSLFVVGPTAAGQEAQPGAGEPGGVGETVVGGVLIPAGASGPGGHLVPLLGRAVAWGAGGLSPGWAGFGEEVASRGGDGPDGAWSLVMSDGGLRAAAREDGEIPEAQAIAFDVSLDCNAFRAGSAQPFSRTARGRALDALTIDNARRARLTGLYADPDDRSAISLVLFTESRAEAPGRRHALPLATATMGADPGRRHAAAAGADRVRRGVGRGGVRGGGPGVGVGPGERDDQHGGAVRRVGHGPHDGAAPARIGSRRAGVGVAGPGRRVGGAPWGSRAARRTGVWRTGCGRCSGSGCGGRARTRGG